MIKAQATPNPQAMKFLCGRKISLNPKSFTNKEDSKGSKLAEKLLSTNGVEMVFFGEDFITITKSSKESWESLSPKLMDALLEHLPNHKTADDLDAQGEFTELEKEILEILEQYVKPAIAMDGGNIIYRGFKEGVVRVSLVGACQGCPSSAMTLKHGIQNTLQYYVPEVISVELDLTEES